MKKRKKMAEQAVAEIEDEADPVAPGEEGVEGEEDEAAGKKKKLKLIIIAAVALVVVLGGAAAAYFMFFSGGGEEADAAEMIAVPETFFYELPKMVVNLSSEAGSEQFLKLSVSLEVADETMIESIEPRIARVLDAFQVYLRELRVSDLEGSAGIFRLKEELRRRVNLALYPVQIESILFKEILVQ